MINLQLLKCFKKAYVQQLDPINNGLMLAIKITLASLIAALIAKYFMPQQGLFLIMGTALFMITNPDASKKQQFIGISLAGLLSALGVLFATLLNQHLIPLLLLTCVYGLISSYVNRINITYGMAGLLALLMIIIAGGVPGDTAAAYDRLLSCLLGLAIGLTMTFIILPSNPTKKLNKVIQVLLNDITDYFYYTTADCLRGNRINPRHWQIKERILISLTKANTLLQGLNPNQPVTHKLQKLLLAEDQLLQSLLPLITLLTSPANNASFINILPLLAEFSQATHTLLLGYCKCLQQSPAPQDTRNFSQSVERLHNEVNSIVKTTLQKPVIYQWPFDLSLFSYLLMLYAKKMLEFNQVLAELPGH